MKIAFFLLLPILLTSVVLSQGITSFSLKTSTSGSPPSNSVDVLTASGDTLWMGTAKGLGFTIPGAVWKSFSNVFPFDRKGISAVAVDGARIWSAIGYSIKKDGQDIQTGGGLTWSADGGLSWTHVPQPVDVGTVDTLTYGTNKIPALAITVAQQNITFDIALTSSSVWITSWAGMLRKSTDNGQTWSRVILPPDFLDSISPSDTLDFDLSPSGGSLGLNENLNHRPFSVYASDDTTLWVGTAAGINLSTDGGISWRRFSHQNQSQPISGNWVVALNEQRYQSSRILWAATVNAEAPDEQPGVSFTEDMGASWKTTLLGERVHNIAFKDSIVYVASNRGLFRSDNKGLTWRLAGTIYDQQTLQRLTTQAVYSVAAQGDSVWVGTGDGIAYTIDSPTESFGQTWHIFRTSESVVGSQTSYSYPLPFSPDDEVVRIHYAVRSANDAVTIQIFDFAMQPVKTIIQNAVRPANTELDEIWDGRNDKGSLVTNGVYFYRIHFDRQDDQWGKIMVIR